MKIRRNILLAALALLLAGGAWAYTANVGSVRLAERSDAVSDAHAQAQSEKYESDKTMYMLKEYYGGIGIYIFDGSEYYLISVTDMDISVLPKQDAEALKKGIYVESKEEMLKLIEDYTS